MSNKKINKVLRKGISAFLSALLIAGICIVPAGVAAEEIQYKYQAVYSFDKTSGTQYGDVTVADNVGIDRQISRAHFSYKEVDGLECLRIHNTRQQTDASYDAYLLNNAGGLFELMPSSEYSVSMKVMVKYAQKTFNEGNITFPTASQYTALNLVYGLPAETGEDSCAADTKAGLIAKIGNDASTFTAIQNGEQTYNVGEWVTLTYNFTTPASFAANGNVLGLSLESYNGIEIYIDEIKVDKICYITVVTGEGKISQTKFPHKIGDKVNIEIPVYKFGYDFDGWYTDYALKNKFTDTVITRENCEIKLYAKYSDRHFSFEAYIPADALYSLNTPFHNIIGNLEDAPDGKNILEYRYVSETYNQLYHEGYTDGSEQPWSNRRTSNDNAFSIKKLSPYTTYVLSYKYKVDKGSVVVQAVTSNNGMWGGGCYYGYENTKYTHSATGGEWETGRMVFTTGSLKSTTTGNDASCAYFLMYAKNHIDTVAYLDDIHLVAIDGDFTTNLDANGGQFKDGKTSKKSDITYGQNINLFETPSREGYDFAGWFLEPTCLTPANQYADGNICFATVYAGWSKGGGFESYNYDTDSADSDKYFSENASIVSENVYNGKYSLKIENKASSDNNMVVLNPISNNQRYLVTFNYMANSLATDVKVRFATMNMDKNAEADVNIYNSVYTVKAAEADGAYYMGAVVIETAFMNKNANRLALVVNSDTAVDYTVYIDDIAVTPLDSDQGFVIFNNLAGKNSYEIDLIGESIEVGEPTKAAAKFMGYYTDKACTLGYTGGSTYSAEGKTIYAKWVFGDGFENYNQSVENVSLIADSQNIDNKYLAFTGDATINIGSVTAGKEYGVDVSYKIGDNVVSTVTLTVDGSSQTKNPEVLGSDWHSTTFVVTPGSDVLTLSVAAANIATVYIDDVIIYEITDSVSVITFNESDSRGEDSVRAGAAGTKINFPERFAYGTDIFYGWATDQSGNSPFVSTTFTGSNTTLYSIWSDGVKVTVTFDDLGENASGINSYDTKAVEIISSDTQSGKYGIVMKMTESGYLSSNQCYFPLVNADGPVKLKANTTYVISFWYRYTKGGSEPRSLTFYACSGNVSATSSNKVGSITIPSPVDDWKQYTVEITTKSTDNCNLYFYISGTRKKYEMYFDTIEIYEKVANGNHTEIYDYVSGVTYEYKGLYGAPIEAPVINSSFYGIGGVYKDQAFTTEAAFVHNNEATTKFYINYKFKDIEFENYEYADTNSRYVRGDDVTVSDEEAYRTQYSLKYNYSYSPNYELSTKNVAALGYVGDNATYKITFSYKLTESQGDVDIKFRTAYYGSYFGLYTDYDYATYRVYSSKLGEGWNKAVVYLTTDFADVGATHLYMSFHPVVEGATTLYVDSVSAELIKNDKAVVAFLGQDGRAGEYVVTSVGSSVSAPARVPASQFAKLSGWYTNKECTTAYTATKLSKGITKVYSKWEDNAVDFSSYAYDSTNSNMMTDSACVNGGELTYTSDGKQGYLRLGKIENNTSYKVSFNYKAYNAGVKVYFATASETDIKVNRTDYNEEGNVRVISASEVTGSSRSAIRYLTSSFTYTIPDDENVNEKENKNAVYGDMLYVIIEGDEGSSISLDNFKVQKIDVLNDAGAMVLTEKAAEEADVQAIRFAFSYKTSDFVNVTAGSDTLTLVERGIIFKNARNTATGTYTDDGVVVSPVTLANSSKKGHAVIRKTNGFSDYWDYNGKTGEMIYSGYITDFARQDRRLMSARGYVKLKDQYGNVYTLYSSEKKTTVKEGEDVNSEYTNVDYHTFAGGRWDQFTIVHPKTMSYIYGMEIENLIAYAKDTHGVTLDRVTEKADVVKNEIVIGDTKRESSKAVAVDDENKYVITVRGGKVIIKGGSDLATMQGVKDFIEYLKMKDGLECGADLKEGYYKEGYVKEETDNYKLTFADEFEASQVDASVWKAHGGRRMGSWSGRETFLGGRTDFRNPGDPGYTTYLGREVKNGIFTTNGNAVLTAARIGEGGINNIASEMSTAYTMGYKYGMWEIKTKLSAPVSYTGFWTGGTNSATYYHRDVQSYHTEIDLLENFGDLNKYVANVHYWWTKSNQLDARHSSLDGSDEKGNSLYPDRGQIYAPDSDETNIYDDYHTFTYLWTPEKEIFAFDGIKFFEFSSPHNQNVTTDFLIISQCMCAVGMGERAWNGATDEQRAVDYYETYLDYIRIYQREDFGSELNWAKH